MSFTEQETTHHPESVVLKHNRAEIVSLSCLSDSWHKSLSYEFPSMQISSFGKIYNSLHMSSAFYHLCQGRKCYTFNVG